MKDSTSIFDWWHNLKEVSLWNWINILLLCTTVWIWCTANNIATIQTQLMSQQTEHMNKQNEIVEAQTAILEEQTRILAQQADFEESRFWSELAAESENKMNAVFDKIMGGDPTLTAVHVKIRDWVKVENIDNLNRYVSEFEEIGGQFCKWVVQKSSLIRILRNQIRYACGNLQINLHYQDTKSGFSALCETIFPSTQGMAKFANPHKCPVLNN